MERFKNYVWMAAGFMILATAISAFVPGSALAQIVKAALVKNVDEPARIPYFVSAKPTCNSTNGCFVAGPIVGANKRVRVTRLEGMFFSQTGAILFYLSKNNDFSPVLMFQAFPIPATVFGNVLSFNQEVDFYFEAGQTPYLGVASDPSSSFSNNSDNRLTITGYIVDLTI